MDVNQNNIDANNAKVTVKVTPEDYEAQVKKILVDYQKKANMPGFRPGKVPFGMVKKMYGNSVLAEEINKVLMDGLYKHINDNKLAVLGNPMPNEEEGNKIDIENDTTFEFSYDLGLSPEFDINLSEKDKYNFYNITIDDDLIKKYTKDIAKRYGKVEEAEATIDTDMISGEFKELNDDGSVKEGGISHTSTIAIEYIEDKKAQKTLIGLKKDDTLTVDPVKLSKGTADLAAMLNVSKAKAENIKGKYSVSIKHIYRMAPAEVNQELFDKAFGEGTVKTTEEFETRISEELTKALSEDADKFLKKEVADALMGKLKLELPDAFLKRWLMETNKDNDKLTPETLVEEYPEYAKGLRWTLIENKLVENNGIKIEPEEAENKAKELFKMQMSQYGYPEVSDEQLAEAAKNILGKEEDAKRIYDDLMDKKMVTFFKDTLTLKEKEVSFDEFVKLASGKPAKGKVMEALGNLVKF